MAVTQDNALHRSLLSASPSEDVADREADQTDKVDLDVAVKPVDKASRKADKPSQAKAHKKTDALFEVAAIVGHTWHEANQVSCYYGC